MPNDTSMVEQVATVAHSSRVSLRRLLVEFHFLRWRAVRTWKSGALFPPRHLIWQSLLSVRPGVARGVQEPDSYGCDTSYRGVWKSSTCLAVSNDRRVCRCVSQHFSDSVQLDVESQWGRRLESSQVLGHCFQGFKLVV